MKRLLLLSFVSLIFLANVHGAQESWEARVGNLVGVSPVFVNTAFLTIGACGAAACIYGAHVSGFSACQEINSAQGIVRDCSIHENQPFTLPRALYITGGTFFGGMVGSQVSWVYNSVKQIKNKFATQQLQGKQ